MVGRPRLAEREPGAVRGVDAEPARVHAFPLEERAAELAVAVVADPAQDARPDTEAGEPGCDVAGEAPDEAREALDLGERSLELVRVEVREQPPDDEDVGHPPRLSAS